MKVSSPLTEVGQNLTVRREPSPDGCQVEVEDVVCLHMVGVFPEDGTEGSMGFRVSDRQEQED